MDSTVDARELPPRVSAMPGTVPAPRDGPVAFFANLAHIFFDNRALTGELRAMVEGLETYGGRLYPIVGLLWSGNDNLLALERPPLPELREYLGEALGLALPEVLDFDADVDPPDALLERMGTRAGLRIDGFVTDERLAGLAQRCGSRLAGSVRGSREGNNKLLLHRHLEQAGEPVFETLLATTPGEVAAAAAELARRGFARGVAKTPVGASGIGLVKFRCATPPVIPASHFSDGPCLVQGWLDEECEGVERVASPSVQMLVDDLRIELFDLTDQILSEESVHEGNVSPPRSFDDAALRAELLRQSGVAGRWLHSRGYRGTASADFHLAFESTGNVVVRICELNARVTGATYPSLLARHFRPGGAWLMRNLRLREPRRAGPLLGKLDASGLLFDGSARGGVLPLNLNYGKNRRVTKGQFLFVGDESGQVSELLRRTVELEALAITRD